MTRGGRSIPIGNAKRSLLITGGAGFIGINLADRAIRDGHAVTIFDDFSRRGTHANLAWLRDQHGDSFSTIIGSVCDTAAADSAVRDADVVYHLAAQAAVTTSVTDPRRDFEINAVGTFNVLEAARHAETRPIVIYASTNKVYGGLEEVPIVELATRYAYRDLPAGVPETQPLDFHSPYGCSKGAADQYVRDYARIYDLPTVVFRQSCIYGQRQMGVEDQGWVAWFLIALISGNPITIYGDGKQTRDLLHIDDLADAFAAAVDRIDVARGQIYNLGGGVDNSVSVWWEFRDLVAEALGRDLSHPTFAPARPGDQRVFIADTAKAGRDLGWKPRVAPREGIARLADWVERNRDLFTAV